MDPLIVAIRAEARARGLRPWTLARQGNVAINAWQRLLDADDVGYISHVVVMRAAAQLGLRVRVERSG